HQVIVAKQGGNALQVAGTSRVRQQVLPAAGQVVVVALGTDADLDIETEQAQKTCATVLGRARAEPVDLRLQRAGMAPGTQAAQHGPALKGWCALSGSGNRPLPEPAGDHRRW